MKKGLALVLASFAMLALSGCESVAVDSTGAVAPDVAAKMASYSGTYGGNLTLSGFYAGTQSIVKDFRLQFTVDGDHPVVETTQEVLGADCHSHIGKLLNLTVGGAWDAIAVFEFDPGLCAKHVTGRQAVFYIDQSKAVLTIEKSPGFLAKHPGTEVQQQYQVTLHRL